MTDHLSHGARGTVRVGVLLDFGAATPLSILSAARGLCEVVFVCDRTLGFVGRHFTGKFPLAPPFRETGYVVPSTLGAAARAAVLDLTEAAVHALGVRHGATHVEVKLTPAGPRLIEVNRRLGGYVGDLVLRARGIDLTRATLAAALGRALDIPEPAYRRHAFQYFLVPPMEAVALRRLDGIQELTRVPGIQLVEVVKQQGEPLDWRQGTLSYVGIVHGSAPDHGGVLRLVELADQTLRIDYNTPSRSVT